MSFGVSSADGDGGSGIESGLPALVVVSSVREPLMAGWRDVGESRRTGSEVLDMVADARCCSAGGGGGGVGGGGVRWCAGSW